MCAPMSSQLTQNEFVTKHINQVNKMAWSYSKTTGVEFDDLKSEGTLALIKAIRSFDPSKGYALSTLVHVSCNNAMAGYIARLRNNPVACEQVDIKSKYACPVKRFEFMDVLESLGNEAKQIIKVIFAAPGEVLNIASDECSLKVLFEVPGEVFDAVAGESPCKARVSIKKYMRELGFTKAEINKGIQEIQSTFMN